MLLAPGATAARFAGVVRSDLPYGAEDRFTCPRGHARLDPACTCGFYAVPTRVGVPHSVSPSVVLQVELAGTVVEHERCWRGERQRVLGAFLPARCAFCVAPAEGLAGLPASWADLPEGWLRGVALCRAHGAERAARARPGELASLLGVEVVWEPEAVAGSGEATWSVEA